MSLAMTTPTETDALDWADLSDDDLERLKLSPEVAWYLEDRGFGVPDCPPLIKTPEPRHEPGARFDPERVDRVLKAFLHLRHTKGALAGQPLKPDNWQMAYILAPTFGWVARDQDTGEYARIISTLYVELPRKNGKTTIAGGIGMYMTAADGEPGAQVVAAATNKDQARFAFDPIRQLAESSPSLKGNVTALKSRVIHKRSGSYFQPVANVGDAQHGADLHCGIVDELHLHKTPDLVEALETGTGSRRQPLIVFITTADAGRRETPYDRKRTRVEQLARGALKDPSTYGVVFAADVEDDPFEESTWKKANPGFGISPTRRFMVSAAAKAKDSPAELASFLRLHLGIRTRQLTRYIDLDAWDRNASMVDELRLAGRDCWGGLDLGSTSDLSALCWAFPDDDRVGFDLLFRLWTPEDNLVNLDKRTAGGASRWVKEGWLTLTPGNVTDYEFIEAVVTRDSETFSVKELAYDPWNATQLASNLVNNGAPMVTMRQGFATMSGPTKELQRMTLLGTEESPILRHGGNPLLRWMADNFAIAMDAAGNVKPDKANAADKIDGIVALIMAVARAIEAAPQQETEVWGFYES